VAWQIKAIRPRCVPLLRPTTVAKGPAKRCGSRQRAATPRARQPKRLPGPVRRSRSAAPSDRHRNLKLGPCCAGDVPGGSVAPSRRRNLSRCLAKISCLADWRIQPVLVQDHLAMFAPHLPGSSETFSLNPPAQFRVERGSSSPGISLWNFTQKTLRCPSLSGSGGIGVYCSPYVLLPGGGLFPSYRMRPVMYLIEMRSSHALSSPLSLYAFARPLAILSVDLRWQLILGHSAFVGCLPH